MTTGTKNRGCVGKVRHETRPEAVRHLEQMVSRGAFADRLNVYRCRHCAGFHVGHRPGRRNR